ncbi:protein STRUBBELIG-RECEPTOR FAMILY 3 isoform X2 [Phalaenopsis equestris]|uniref:protein STRUBBELIG-RECEPTOR FAMILY 3 isoform X2 n=1 Tax=Phalaenopsis equestris TaxID=78828 RepID=UPI0009E2A6A4|nr:protein STRUBBELIG-RECEPTOR FAMILY 3 isoform X2 [Phalaenopsis equestris]
MIRELRIMLLRISRASVIVLMVIVALPLSHSFTTDQDVFAINSLYAALGSPPLPGWIPNGGDPCIEGWQGIQCVGPNISSVTINGANLRGQLGSHLENFSSIVTIFLSANQFTGNIPASLSKLTLLSDMSVNANNLSGELPDAFQSLIGLINLDLSANNISGQLPPSMRSLSSLTTLHVQDNKLSGTLDVLQDLPLKNLNVENNLFSGPIPEKMLSIPIFKKDGNPFNTTVAPSSTPVIPPAPSPFSGAPSPQSVARNSSEGSSAPRSGEPAQHKSTSAIKIVGYVLAGVVSFIMIVLAVVFCLSKLQERSSERDELPVRQQRRAPLRTEEPKSNEQSTGQNERIKKPPRQAYVEPKQVPKISMTSAVQKEDSEKQKKLEIDKVDSGIFQMTPLLPPPPPPPPLPSSPPVEQVIVNPIFPPEESTATKPSVAADTPSPVTSYSVATLQQYTNSFREENVIKDSRLGKVYLGELPDGKPLAVMKLDNANSKIPVDDFLELVLSISELRHPNILELVGYCSEHGLRLLVYNYFSKRTLHDILHGHDELKGKLSWNARLKIALGAARALEYLHEFQPPMFHLDFEPSNVLVNDELAVRVADCGLASLLSSDSVTQLSGRMRALLNYEAPEVHESGAYSERSDVYSFGVVMLELLAGREPYDSSLPRAEQHLVRWANSQLHDIDALSRMVDPSICGKYSEKSLSRFADIISRCIQQGPEFRPQMSEVVHDLARMVDDITRSNKDLRGDSSSRVSK